MINTPAAPPTRITRMGLLARGVGIVASPRATYARIIAEPRALDALAAVIAIMGFATFAFLSTEVGRIAMLDRQLSSMEAFGRTPTAPDMAGLEQFAAVGRYIVPAGLAVFVPLLSAIAAGIATAAFKAEPGGAATFKRVYAVIAHSWFLIALQTLLALPLNYVRESLTSVSSLAVFMPVFDDASFPGRLMGSIDLFRIWWIINLSLGLGVLYKRRAGPIAGMMVAMYAMIALVLAAAMAILSGA